MMADQTPGRGEGQRLTQEGPTQTTVPIEQSGKKYSPLQLWALRRFSYVDKTLKEYGAVLDEKDWRLRGLNKARFSVYEDCVELGLRDEIKRLGLQSQPQVSAT